MRVSRASNHEGVTLLFRTGATGAMRATHQADVGSADVGWANARSAHHYNTNARSLSSDFRTHVCSERLIVLASPA